jgi:hypothetical protein
MKNKNHQGFSLCLCVSVVKAFSRQKAKAAILNRGPWLNLA